MNHVFLVSADGMTAYLHYEDETDFSENKWGKIVRAKLGNFAVVHHIIAFILLPTMKMHSIEASC